jgi:Zn-dependent oligopeptidase
MDIIKKIFNLKSNILLDKINSIIKESEQMINKITLKNDMSPDDKIKCLIRDTFIFDTYYCIINLRLLLSETDDTKILLMAETKLKNYNIDFNKNINLLNLIVDLIKNTDDIYNKIFLAKMGQSFEKYGCNLLIPTNNSEKIPKILLQLEQTENVVLANIDKPTKIKLDRTKIDARSESIMSSVYPDNQNNILLTKNKYYFLLKRINDRRIRNEIEDKFMKKFINVLPLIGKLLILRDAYAKNSGFNTFYEMISKKNDEETEHIHNLIKDLNVKLDDKFNNIINNICKLVDIKQITLNDLIFILYKTNNTLDSLNILNIKLKPIDIMQIVMFIVQKKFSIEFKYSKCEQLNNYFNTIEVFDYQKKLRGYLHIDLLDRQNKKINQITVIKLNNCFKENLPNICLLGCYLDLEKDECSFADLVLMFREFGNILMNIFAFTPNGINEIDTELYNFIPDIMEFIAYDDIVLSLVCQKMKINNQKKIINHIKKLRNQEIIINLKLKCFNALYDNVLHNSNTLINDLKKLDLEQIKNKLLVLNNIMFNDFFGKTKITKNNTMILPQSIYNLIDGNQGLLFGTIISYILAFNCHYLINTQNSTDFIIKLLENKDYSYKKTILEYISSSNIDYYKNFLKNCLNIEDDDNNYYDENTEKLE